MPLAWRAAALEALRERSESWTLWEQWAHERSDRARQALVQRYTNFARTLAARAFASRAEAGLEFDDYLHYAYQGLLEAIDRYDHNRGIRFESFATLRVSGAISDGVESLCERHRQIAARQRMIKERTRALTDEIGDIKGAAAVAVIAEIAVGIAVGLLLEDSGMFFNPEVEPSLPDNAYHSVELQQTRKILRRLVNTLEGNERKVVTMHYLHGLPFTAIADELQLSKGRISQLHRTALLHLRSALVEQNQIYAVEF